MIGKILRFMRISNNYKQTDLQSLVNIPQNTISQYETGSIQPTFDIIEKIADSCNYDIQFIHRKTKKVITSENINRLEI